MGHDIAGIGAIGGTDPKESIAGIENAVQGVVVELFPKIRFGRAEMFSMLSSQFASLQTLYNPHRTSWLQIYLVHA
jgi:hypothetical protein